VFALIMADPPSDLALVARVTAFGQELAGTLRRASVIDALMRHVRETLAPSEIAVALLHRDTDTRDYPQSWPPGRPERHHLLEITAQQGARVYPEGVGAAGGPGVQKVVGVGVPVEEGEGDLGR
jgi:hypothetical protein